ncbi:MAG: RluA family pseudouridine synthase [Firmicutes bacterium]|nr:RluA family pseudouridine synthase [Bacillota bacterium]
MKIDAKDIDSRLDQWLAKTDSKHSRARWQSLIDDGYVLVNGVKTKSSHRLTLKDEITLLPFPTETISIKPEALPLEIVYQDQDLAIILKPQGMVVHPAPGHPSGTLVNALLHHLKDLSGIHGEIRPGIVHRLDKDTSGLMVVAKHDDSHRFLAAQLKDHEMKRDYYALVRGVIKENKGKIIAPIGRDPDDRLAMDVIADGKEAETSFDVIERFANHTLVACHLATGRTHQIRVHMNFIHRPIESDPIYMPQKHPLHPGGQLLHAYQLTLTHPSTKKKMTFTAPLPNYFEAILKKLRT